MKCELQLGGGEELDEVLSVPHRLDILQPVLQMEPSPACFFLRMENIFWRVRHFPNFKKGLISVRNNIEAKMCDDRDYLLKLNER